jgi:hypothetical protein
LPPLLYVCGYPAASPVVLDMTALPAPLPKGRNDQVFVAVFMQVPPAFCAIVKVPFTVTPEPGVTVTTPAPRFAKMIFVPTA